MSAETRRVAALNSAGTPMRQRSSDPERRTFFSDSRGAQGALQYSLPGEPQPPQSKSQLVTRLGELEIERRNACRRSSAPCPPKPRFGGHTHAHAPRSAPFTRHSVCYIPCFTRSDEPASSKKPPPNADTGPGPARGRGWQGGLCLAVSGRVCIFSNELASPVCLNLGTATRTT
jgi:hypothetical protein